MLAQSLRALAYLDPDSLNSRASANWTLGYAYLLERDYAAARRAFAEAISIGQAAEDAFATILANIGLGAVQEAENQLHVAAETYRRVLQLAGDQPLQIVSEAHLGLARVLYEWNDLEAAEQHGRQALELARQYGRSIDRFVSSEVFLARLKLAQGDVAGAAAMVDQADRSVRQYSFVHRMPEVVDARVRILLRQGALTAAVDLARAHALPLSQARAHLAGGDTSAALATLAPWRQQAEAQAWEAERLRTMALQAAALHAHGEANKALKLLDDVLELAEPAGLTRTFVDEGLAMARLLSGAVARGKMSHQVGRLVAAFEAQEQEGKDKPGPPSAQSLVEPLSPRELGVLQLVAEGLSNREIGERLFLALSTVKGHNRNIFGKLRVQRRTEAVARARELGLL
jgi:LuxR family maltose regulon positive regulatory protein